MIRNILTFICLVSALCMRAQNIYFNHLTPADGLSQISVNSLYADNGGVIWMATRVGLDSYDGNAIHVYSYQPGNSNSLFCNNVRLVTGDHNRNLYLVSSEGVASLDIRTQKFSILRRCNAAAICYGDALYLAVGNTIERLDTANGNSKQIASVPKGTKVTSLFHDSHKRLWIGTDNSGLYCLTNGRLSHTVSEGQITTVYEDSHHNIWVGSWSNGFWTITPNSKIKNTTTSDWLATNFVRTFCEDNSGNMWIGTYHGLYRLDPKTGEHRLFTADGMPGSLTNSSIWSIIKDSQGTLWLGTYFGGVNYFNPDNEIYTRYRAMPGSTAGLSFSVVGNMTEDGSGRLWICTEGGGMNILDRSTGRFTHFANIPTANLKAIYYDKKRKAMWIGTHLGGLCRVDIATGHVTTYKHHGNDKHSLPSNIVRSISPYGDKLVIGTNRGVAMMDPDAKGESCFTPLLSDKHLLAVPSTCVDKKGYLWIATEGIGVFRVDPKNGSYKQFTHSADNKYTPSSNYVNHIMLDRLGRLWFSMANNSICLYNDKDNTFTTYGDAQGLTSDCVYATAPSTLDNRDLLLITNRGFSVFDFDKQHFRNYDRSTGFPLESINENALYVSADGTVFLGGIDGMVTFNERDLYKKAQPYHIGFSRLYVNGEKINPDDETGILSNALRFTKEVVLNHNQRVFSVEVYTTNFFKTNATPLQFRLKGVSDRWFNVRQKQLSFNGLSSGKYTLEVRSTDGNATMASLQIRILPPWYLSWWAYIIYIVSTAAAAWWLIREYRDRIRMSESLKFEQQRVKDIQEQNQSKLRFFTNVSHEIRTPLTVIIGLSESLLQSSAFAADIRNKILGIYRNSNQLRSLISELLDFRKQEQGHIHIYVKEQDLVVFIRETATLFKEYATMKDVALELHMPPSLPMWFDRKQMLKVINNLISNAMKHTPQGGTIAIYVEQQGDKALIKVTDTGKGIAKEELANVFGRFYQVRGFESFSEIGTGIGLNLTQGIVKLHHGTITVDSTLGKGTTFTVTLPISKNAFAPDEIDDKPAATKIEYNEEQEKSENSKADNATANTPGSTTVETQTSDTTATPTDEARPTILIVEDNDDIRQLLVTLFSPFYRTITAVDGREALEMVTDEMPDLVLSDVLMPHMSGIELCKAIKRDFSICHIPVVLLTARTAVEQAIEGLKTGADDYVTKPFNSDVLISRCNNLVNTRRLLQRKFGEHPHTEADVLATNPMDKDLLDRAMKIIDKYYTDSSFSVDTFAKEIGMSRTAFFNKWKDLTGDTPKGFILSMRLRKAADMLRNHKEMSISEVSYANGFSSPRYFCKCFKDAYKVQPSAYRNGEA